MKTIIKVSCGKWNPFYSDTEVESQRNQVRSLSWRIEKAVKGESGCVTMFGLINNVKTDMSKESVLDLIQKENIPKGVSIEVKTEEEISLEEIMKKEEELKKLKEIFQQKFKGGNK